MIYLDYASHMPPSKVALEAFFDGETRFAANANARHPAGLTAREEYERAKTGIAGLLGAKPDEVQFTSGASEGNNLAIKGITRAYPHVGRHVLSTPLAHPSESGALAALTEQGYEVGLLRVKPDGKIDLSHLKTVLRKDTVLVCVSAVDSELGVIQPLDGIVETMKAFPRCHLHIDAAQAVGKVDIPLFSALNASTLAISAHKFGGVGGCGVLLKRGDVVLEPFVHGGGTPALGLAASCYAALEEALRLRGERFDYVMKLRTRVVDALSAFPRVRVNSPANASPYILNISIDGLRGTAVRDALNHNGIYISVKSACATDNSPSRPVLAISDKKNALASWRVSFSYLTTEADIDGFLHGVELIIKEGCK